MRLLATSLLSAFARPEPSWLRPASGVAARPSLRILGSVLLLTLALTGCQNQSTHQMLLEQENAQLCEQITQMELMLYDKDVELRRLARLNAAKATASSARRPTSGGSISPPPAAPPGGLQLGDPQSSAGSGPAALAIDLQESGPFAASGGTSSGLLMVVDALDARSRPVEIEGDVAVAVWDSQLLEKYRNDPQRRDQARVAVWKFDGRELSRYRETVDGRPRLRFILPWSQSRPQHDDVFVYVRLLTPEGRELLTHEPMSMAIGGGASSHRVSTPTARNPSPAPEASPLPSAVEEEFEEEIPPPRPRLSPALNDGDGPSYPESAGRNPARIARPQNAGRPALRDDDAGEERPPVRTADQSAQPGRDRPQWRPYR